MSIVLNIQWRRHNHVIFENIKYILIKNKWALPFYPPIHTQSHPATTTHTHPHPVTPTHTQSHPPTPTHKNALNSHTNP